VSLWPGSLPRVDEVQVDWRVLLFALGVSLASSVLFGLVPARHLDQRLRSGGRTTQGSVRRWHSVFVISEIALAVVLLVCAGVLGRTLLRLSSLHPGVDVRDVLVARVALSPTAYLTAERTPEIGVRMALGASRADVIQLVLGQSLRMIAGGAVAGTLAAFAASRLLERLVDGVRSVEPSAFAAMIALLVIAALLASAVPVRRATRVDPIAALRQD
jgi:FtsX-like permease family